MNLLPILVQTLRGNPWRAFPFAAIAGAGLVALTLQPGSHGNTSLYLIQAAAFFMLFLSSSAATRLAQTAQVLAQRRVPETMWTDSVALRLASVWANGIALLVALSVQWALSADARAPVLAGAATLSLAACTGTLFSTLRSGLLPRLSPRVTGGLALAFIPAFVFYGHQLLIAATDCPAAVLLALTLCWPVMGWALRRHWRVMPSLPAPAPTAAGTAHVPAWVVGLSRRIPLHPMQRGGVWKSSTVHGLQMGLAMLAVGMREGEALGDLVTVRHLLSLAGFLPIALFAVSMRDLHWRSMLLPGGVSRGSLALRIYMTTLQFAATTLLSVLVGVMLSDYLLMGKSVANIQASLEHWVILAMEVPLLAAVAVLLTALPLPHVTLWCSCIASVAVYIASLLAKLQTVPVKDIHTGPVYGAAMLTLAGLVMLLADRLWTPRRLLPYLPERPTGAAFSAAR